MKLYGLSLLLLAGALIAPATATDEDKTRRTDDPPPVEDEVKKLKIGSTVPERLALPDFEGEVTKFKDLRGKVVIVHFWSYRCPAERHANPVFMAMEKKYEENEDVVIVGIVSNQNELGAKPAEDADLSKHYTELRKQRDKVGFKHVILADHGNVVSDLFQARSTPHCYVIDKKGVLQYSGALDDDPRGRKGDEATNYVVDATTAVLAGKRPEVTETRPYG